MQLLTDFDKNHELILIYKQQNITLCYLPISVPVKK